MGANRLVKGMKRSLQRCKMTPQATRKAVFDVFVRFVRFTGVWCVACEFGEGWKRKSIGQACVFIFFVHLFLSVFMHNSWCSRHFTLISLVSVGVFLVQSVVISRICFQPVSLMLPTCPRWLKACLTLKRRLIPTIVFSHGSGARSRVGC